MPRKPITPPPISSLPVKIGLCGFTMAIRNYPHHFPVVEIQQTFYQPSADFVMTRWRASVPNEFEFTIKAWQLITHAASSPTYRRLRRELTPTERAGAGGFRDTPIVHEAWQTTVDAARLLKATAILFQCPPSFGPTPENIKAMQKFFQSIQRPPGVKLLWEPRGEWPVDTLAMLCQTLHLAHVVDPFLSRTVTTGYVYYRLHGVGTASHVYTDAELLQLRDSLPSDGQTYVMFNNLPRVGDAQRFAAMLRQS